MQIAESIWDAYGFNKEWIVMIPFGNGLINNTWKIQVGANQYILQNINQQVFKDPTTIASNISLVAAYLAKHYPNYLFIAPVKTKAGTEMVLVDNIYFRLFHFVEDSHAKTVLQTADEAYEAAKQFGRFTKLLSGFDTDLLKNTLPKFHDLSERDQQFEDAIKEGNQDRKRHCSKLIETIQQHKHITQRYLSIVADPAFKLRVTHHDTKISNVLFDVNDKAICVIDLDTLMPGYFISDLGDMMRTYLCPVSEEESDFSKITIREDFYHAIIQGYCEEMELELTLAEKDALFYAGQFMIYMQALRFMTDYLNNDRYYGASYPEQNLVRAGNQMVLLERLMEIEHIKKL